MLAAIPPAFILVILVILLGTQVAYVLAPRRPPYLVRLGISALALLLGELSGAAGLLQSLALGELHPATDITLLILFQWLASRLVRREQAV